MYSVEKLISTTSLCVLYIQYSVYQQVYAYKIKHEYEQYNFNYTLKIGLSGN